MKSPKVYPEGTLVEAKCQNCNAPFTYISDGLFAELYCPICSEVRMIAWRVSRALRRVRTAAHALCPKMVREIPHLRYG